MIGESAERAVMSVLAGGRRCPPPLWMMRQAGRYLPEYRAVREKAGGFLDLCYTPDLATEVTLQPIRRFGFDAAILFSDILVVPHALGQEVRFEVGEGPRLDPITNGDHLRRLATTIDLARLAPVIETVRQVRRALPNETTLLGFCGAPWTVATYMIAGRGTDDQGPARLAAYRTTDFLKALIDRLVEASVAYLVAQLQAGADAVQVFDTWAGVLPPSQFERWVIEPTVRIVRGVRAAVPGARIIGFPRGAAAQLPRYVAQTGVDAVGLDWTAEPQMVRERVQTQVAVQGNIDPLALIAGGDSLDRAVDATLEAFGGGRYIANLGHGIQPSTPIAHVERMVNRIRAWRGGA